MILPLSHKLEPNLSYKTLTVRDAFFARVLFSTGLFGVILVKYMFFSVRTLFQVGIRPGKKKKSYFAPIPGACVCVHVCARARVALSAAMA